MKKYVEYLKMMVIVIDKEKHVYKISKKIMYCYRVFIFMHRYV